MANVTVTENNIRQARLAAEELVRMNPPSTLGDSRILFKTEYDRIFRNAQELSHPLPPWRQTRNNRSTDRNYYKEGAVLVRVGKSKNGSVTYKVLHSANALWTIHDEARRNLTSTRSNFEAHLTKTLKLDFQNVGKVLGLISLFPGHGRGRARIMDDRMLDFIQQNAAPRVGTSVVAPTPPGNTVGGGGDSNNLPQQNNNNNNDDDGSTGLSSPTAGLKLLLGLPPDQRETVSNGFFTAVASKNNAVTEKHRIVTSNNNKETAKIIATYNDNQCAALSSFNSSSLSASASACAPLSSLSLLGNDDITEEEEDEENSNSEDKDDDNDNLFGNLFDNNDSDEDNPSLSSSVPVAENNDNVTPATHDSEQQLNISSTALQGNENNVPQISIPNINGNSNSNNKSSNKETDGVSSFKKASTSGNGSSQMVGSSKPPVATLSDFSNDTSSYGDDETPSGTREDVEVEFEVSLLDLSLPEKGPNQMSGNEVTSSSLSLSTTAIDGQTKSSSSTIGSSKSSSSSLPSTTGLLASTETETNTGNNQLSSQVVLPSSSIRGQSSSSNRKVSSRSSSKKTGNKDKQTSIGIRDDDSGGDGGSDCIDINGNDKTPSSTCEDEEVEVSQPDFGLLALTETTSQKKSSPLPSNGTNSRVSSSFSSNDSDEEQDRTNHHRATKLSTSSSNEEEEAEYDGGGIKFRVYHKYTERFFEMNYVQGEGGGYEFVEVSQPPASEVASFQPIPLLASHGDLGIVLEALPSAKSCEFFDVGGYTATYPNQPEKWQDIFEFVIPYDNVEMKLDVPLFGRITMKQKGDDREFMFSFTSQSAYRRYLNGKTAAKENRDPTNTIETSLSTKEKKKCEAIVSSDAELSPTPRRYHTADVSGGPSRTLLGKSGSRKVAANKTKKRQNISIVRERGSNGPRSVHWKGGSENEVEIMEMTFDYTRQSNILGEPSEKSKSDPKYVGKKQGSRANPRFDDFIIPFPNDLWFSSQELKEFRASKD
eukprot:CAMPEP_0113446048 /NCGR_PEP_ID=MMETSP0014_2-20120614/3502_1 /TAXON_ID=2857 /ORGANISM="Nitzschia sp." /LENGTH=992 /DNA_ID=CAMNT_0000337121 /DNA_START=8 /DNA_END=2985 /DNA_ORIENTATION=+ /assembly_acc=CAM_ASM_000159